ncbi:MAG: DinB family protein [Acidobacteriota bacterium]
MTAAEFGECIEILQSTPSKVRGLLSGLSNDELDQKAKTEPFSLTEHVAHLRDLEINGYRIWVRGILYEKTPTFESPDFERLGKKRGNRSAIEMLEELEAARRANLGYVANMTAAQWERKAILGGAEITLLSLVDGWAKHDLEHLEQMAQLRQVLKQLAVLPT